MQGEHLMRTLTTTILLAITLTGTAAAQDSTAPANTNQPPPATTQDRPLGGNTTNGLGSVWQAPVGHRQPTLNGLPPAVRHDERSETDGQRVVDPFANVPNICSGC